MFLRLTASVPVPNAVARVIASENRASATAHTSCFVIFGPPSSAISHIVSIRNASDYLTPAGYVALDGFEDQFTTLWGK